MNWKEIEEKYPKAFKKMLRWYFPKANLEKESVIKNILLGVLIRDLYDLFDNNGIIITLEYNSDKPACFEWCIDYKDKGGIEIVELSWTIQVVYELRKNAETEAFVKAFEILENKLNN